ncbi:MAG: hypothetical protein ACYSSL_03325 [Planctomycetota bacterium]|jgi:hypothetical protein
MRIAVHITHESVKKIGGIGAVLSGICNLQTYKDFYNKTVFYGPLFDLPTDTFSHFGKLGKILFSSHDHYDTEDYSKVFDEITKKYNVEIVYGKRELVSEFDVTRHTSVDVINVGINKMHHSQVEKFKYTLWKNFGIKSHLYEEDWDYEQYLRIAVPFIEILEKLYGPDVKFYHFAHEYMGVPSVLSVLISKKKHTSVFVAHEVSTARSLVESHPGHDISFYNILKKAASRKSLEQIFGSQEYNPRSELIKKAVNFDYIFAVGNHVRDEYMFLVPDAPPEKIKIVYNAVSAKTISFEQKLQARAHIEKYTDTLFNFTPDAVFTHITRLVISKGIWRDIELLGFLDNIFDAHNLKAVYILLSTVIADGRSSQDIFRMEYEYGWPLLHKNGWPDLIGLEKDTYEQLQIFNARSKAIKGVFLNQFGFNKTRCGKRLPQNAEFSDLRNASDAEFGFSIYEPFGIAQIETIPFGGIALLSSSCGAAALLAEKLEKAPIKPFYIVDYIATGSKMRSAALKNLTIPKRTLMEKQILSAHAKKIFNCLPLTSEKRKQYLLNAQKYAPAIRWEALAQSYVLNFNPST